VYDLEPGYDSAKYVLNAMLERTELVRGKERPLIQLRLPRDKDRSKPNLYHRPAAIIRRDDHVTYGHDMATVTAFVLLQASGCLKAFRRFWTKEAEEYYGKKYGLYPDAVFRLTSTPEHAFFLETDAGTEWAKGQIQQKCAEYVQYANAHPGERFTVLFPTKGAYEQTDEERMADLLEVFAKFRRQNMFLTTTWDRFVGDLKLMNGDPLGPIFRSPWTKPHNPLDPEGISLLDVK